MYVYMLLSVLYIICNVWRWDIKKSMKLWTVLTPFRKIERCSIVPLLISLFYTSLVLYFTQWYNCVTAQKYNQRTNGASWNLDKPVNTVPGARKWESWCQYLVQTPESSSWENRTRFVFIIIFKGLLNWLWNTFPISINTRNYNTPLFVCCLVVFSICWSMFC